MTMPKHSSAGGARRPVPAVIVRPELGEESLPLTRVGPAGLMSTIFHGALFALFAWLAPRGIAIGPTESRIESVIEADANEDETRSKFLALEVNPAATEPGEDPGNDSPHKAELTIFGETRPGEQLGMPSSQPDGPPVSVNPLFGPTDGWGRRESLTGPPIDQEVASKPGGGRWLNALSRNTLKGRTAGTKEGLFARGDSTTSSEAAVAKGLVWLARVQSANGAWQLDGNFPDKGNANDVAGTALGLLPFLGAGKTHKVSKDNPYDKPIDKALRFLLETQDKRSGAFSRDMYAHGLAAIAVSEAFALSQDYNLKKPAQNAMNYILKAQHEGGGWRYSPGQAGDTSVSGWQIMALKSGLMAGLDVPEAALRRTQRFLDAVADPATEGSGYTGPQATPTMTAVSLLCRQYISGWGGQNIRLIKAVDNHIKPNFPRPEKKDVYFYYYATQVMHNLGGDDWKAWNVKMREQLVASQDGDTTKPATYGSWSPAGDQWGRTGGRLMVTSLNLLTLEVYYRYLPLYYRETGVAGNVK